MKLRHLFNLISALFFGMAVYTVYLNPVAAVIATGTLLAASILLPKMNRGVAYEGIVIPDEETNKLLDKVKSEVKSQLEKNGKGLTKEEVDGIIKEATKHLEGIEPDQFKAIQEDLEDLKELTEKFNNKVDLDEQRKNYREVIKDAFSREGLVNDIKKVHEAKHGHAEIIKAVGPIGTGNVTTTSGGNAILDMMNADDIRAIGLRDTWIEQYATVSRSSKPVYTYTEWVPGEGDAGFTAEAAAKSQMDHDAVTRSLTPNKATGYEILSDEAIDDVPRMESQARAYIMRKVMLKRQNGILFGDGVGANPLGLTAVAPLFDAASWGDVIALGEFNEYAAIIAVLNQINLAENYTDDIDYSANLIVMNPADIAQMKLRRDSANGGYLFPTMGLLGNNTVENIPVVGKKDIPAGSILVGDFTKLSIVNYIDFALSAGWINDQFIKNQFTLLGENRFYSYVKNLDQIGFVYDTFANIKTGIESAT